MGYYVKSTIDLTHFENENKFLEGTGSMVLDRENKICYAAVSERTNHNLLIEFCSKTEFELVSFKSYQSVGNKRKEIYHTNVIMCIADKYAIICLESVDNKKEKEKIAVTQVVPMKTNADPMAEVGDRLREARRMYGAGSEEYKTAVEEAKKTKESMVASKDVV